MATKFSDKFICVANTLQTLQDNLQCVICLETLKQPVSTRCGHTFCQPCISRVVKGKNAVCPLCNARVNRRGIVENEKIKSLVQAVHVLMSSAQKDAAEMGCENLLDLAKEFRNSSRESSSPTGNVNAAVATDSGTKMVPPKTSKVETWLMCMSPTRPTQDSSPTIHADNTPNEESDPEMVSVSQIKPETSVSSKIKPLSACIEEDVDADEGNSKQFNFKPKPASKGRAAPKNISIKGKGKQESITNFLGKSKPCKSKPTTSVSSTASSYTITKYPDLKVPDPVVVILNREKENTTNPLPPRSPGWSRINKMKKDFSHPSKVLKVVNSKGGNSPIPVIEDGGSGDDQPCFSLSLDSPVLKKRAKMNEIVTNLESEIIIFEKSVHKKENKRSEQMFQPSTSTRSNHQQPGSKVSSVQPRVRFYKLGPFIARKQQRVPIYLKGPLERADFFDVSSMGYRLLVDAETQTSPKSEKIAQFTVPNPQDTLSSPPLHARSQHRKSSEYDVDMMDAETVVFTQPLRRSDMVIPETLSHDEMIDSGEPVDFESALERDKSLSQISEIFLKGNDPINILSGSRQLSQESVSVVCSPNIENSPKKISDLESQSVINPTIDLDDSCSSVLDGKRSKRIRSLATSSESSDSEVGASKTKTKKKKRSKQPVLSDNEDSCNNQLDISIVDTEKIMANIEAELEESARPGSPVWIQQDSNKTILPMEQTSTNPQTFDENLDVLSDTSATQIDSDADSELINPTPQKQPSFLSRTVTQSDDIVPSSQPSGGSPPLQVSVLQATSTDLPEKESPCIPSVDPKDQKENTILDEICITGNREHVVEPMSLNTSSPAISLAVKPVFVCSSIPANMSSQVEKLAKMVGGEFSSKFSNNTTHLIVRVEEGNKADKTLKYLSAVACGKWVVTFPWVQKCLESNKLIPEEPYEAFDTTGEPGPRRSREARQSGQKLFGGFEFCCIGDFLDLSKSQLEELLVECGGSVVSKPTEFSFQDRIIPICLAQWEEEKEQEYSSWLDKYSSPLIQHEWVLDCIGKFSVTSFAPMLLCDVTDDVLTSMGIPPPLFEFTETDQDQ
ncbi:breast cancer type 1 susceptibility protein homolog isoform X2 [Frankliniella occidentalis]|uniref:RING-type E3 ubiquitin transferase BRCA1 n=1 Tax=Frankliniella occidentalis TaxID=133901 RepID=A0A6J1SJV9_FRAOC|nr:breast cancer type 1 susceptibility protein homolog isoform X2 [Frankliniella occidentalis]